MVVSRRPDADQAKSLTRPARDIETITVNRLAARLRWRRQRPLRPRMGLAHAASTELLGDLVGA